MKRALAAVLGAGLLLAGCGQQSATSVVSPSSAPLAAYGDGLDHSWTTTSAEGQQLYAALSPGLKAQEFNIGLSVTATSGWGPIEVNTSNGETAAGDGKPITLNGKVYTTGLGLHANSEIHVHATNLETPACTRFQADVGIDDEVGDKGSVVFQVFADGVKLFDSGVMTGASATQHIDVGIGNKSDLRFVVTDAGDNNYYDHADWAGAALSCVSAAPAAPNVTFDTDTLNIYHLHTGTIKATFHNYPAGKTNIALSADPFIQPPNSNLQLYPQLALTTTSVTLTGAVSETRDIVISAPVPGVGAATPRSTFHLITTANGNKIDNIPVNLSELPLKFDISFNPPLLAGHPGETLTTTLIVKIDPPVNFTPTLSTAPYAGLPPFFKLNSVGATTGDGSAVSVPVKISFSASSGATSVSGEDFYMSLSGIGGGYRDYFYYNGASLLRKDLNLQLLP